MSKFTVTITLQLKGDSSDETEVKELVTNALEDLIASDTLEDVIVIGEEEEEDEDEDLF